MDTEPPCSSTTPATRTAKLRRLTDAFGSRRSGTLLREKSFATTIASTMATMTSALAPVERRSAAAPCFLRKNWRAARSLRGIEMASLLKLGEKKPSGRKPRQSRITRPKRRKSQVAEKRPSKRHAASQKISRRTSRRGNRQNGGLGEAIPAGWNDPFGSEMPCCEGLSPGATIIGLAESRHAHLT